MPVVGADEVLAVLREVLGDDRDGPVEFSGATARSTLEQLGVTGVDRMLAIAQLEARFDVTFPADLVSSIETVDDLIYYVGVKVEHRRGAAATSVEE